MLNDLAEAMKALDGKKMLKPTACATCQTLETLSIQVSLAWCLAFVGSSLCLLLPPLPPRSVPCGALAQFSRWCLALGIWLQL